MKTPARAPILVRIDTPRFQLRTLTPADATENWLNWARDPEVMSPLNSPIQTLSLLRLQRYIAEHDQVKRLLIGIYEGRAHELIGFYMVEIDRYHRLATLNVVIGDKRFWGRRAVLETRAALLSFLFNSLGAEKAVGMPLARNFPAIYNYRAQGWRLEGVLKEHRTAANGTARLDQLIFGLTRAEWFERIRAEPAAE